MLQAIFDATMLPACMYNQAFHVFGIHIYLRNEQTMTCPRHHLADEDPGQLEEDAADDDNEEVTFRPLSPGTTVANATASPRAPKHTNSPKNNVILDDVVRERGSSSSVTRVSSTCSVYYLLVSCVLLSIYLPLLSTYSFKYVLHISAR